MIINMTPEEQKLFDKIRAEELNKIADEKATVRIEQVRQAAKESVSIKAKAKAIGSTLIGAGNMFAEKIKPLGEQLGNIKLNKPLPEKDKKKQGNPYFPEM